MAYDNSTAFAQQSPQRPICTDEATQRLYTVHPTTGQALWIIDYETGQPMVSRPVFTDPVSNCIYAESVTGGRHVWVIDPATGQPMRDVEQLQASQAQEALQVEQASALPLAAAQASVPPFTAAQTSTQALFQAQAQEASAPAQEPSSPLVPEPFQMRSQPFAQTQAQPQQLAPSADYAAVQSTQAMPYQTAVSPASGTAVNALASPVPPATESPSVLKAAAEPSTLDVPDRNELLALAGDNAPTPTIPQRSSAAHYQVPIESFPGYAGTSGMAITSLVLGILAFLSAGIPLLNFGGSALAVFGILFSIIGIVVTRKGSKKTGQGLAVAGLVLAVLTIAITLITASTIYGPMIEQMRVAAESGTYSGLINNGNGTTVTTGPAGTSGAAGTAGTAGQQSDSPLPIGETTVLDNGLEITVNDVEFDLENYDKSKVTRVNVTYVNTGKTKVSFNLFDWKATNADGVVSSTTIFLDGENALSSGELAGGGTITGDLYFEGHSTLASYYANPFQNDPSATWTLE